MTKSFNGYDNLPSGLDSINSQLAQNAQQLTDIVVTARNVGLVAGDSSKATQNATTLNNYLATAQNTEITFLGKDYYFDNTITITGTNKLIGKKGTCFILTNAIVDFIYLKPYATIDHIALQLPTNHNKSGIILYNGDYTQWFNEYLHQAKNIFIYGDPNSLTSTGISLNASQGYNVSNFSSNNITILNCFTGISITQSGNGWVNGNFFDNVYPQNCKTGISVQNGSGNRFIYQYQFSSSGTTAIYCSGSQNTFIGKVWDAVPGQTIAYLDNGSQSNTIVGTGLTPNIMRDYITDLGQDNNFSGSLNNAPQIQGGYKYDSNNNYQAPDWSRFYGAYSDILFYADKKYTVNFSLGGSSIVFGSMATLFSNGGIILANATPDNPITIEIIFSTAITYAPEFGITFQNGWVPQNVMIEYATTSGGTYSTNKNITNNRNNKVASCISAYGATIGKIRFTLSNGIVNATTNANGRIGIGNIYMFSTAQMGTYYFPSNGGKFYGDVNINGNYLIVGNKASLPTASSTYRNYIATVQGNGTTTADTLYICLMSSTGTYSWKTITTG